jgi:hypothetical protein
MMVGLCAIGTSAAFTDEAQIKNKEAAAVLNSIGVLTGRTDGSFDPTAILTRAEACTIIARLMGNETYMAQKNTAFTDVPASNFYSGYIAFCYDKGIVAGTGKDLFKPNDPLTAAAWAKMLLCTLGYDAEAEGLLGNTWDLNTSVLVSRTKLADGMVFNPSAEMSRDDAALLAFNALTVPEVIYNGFVKVTATDGTIVEVAAERTLNGDFLCENFDLDAAEQAEGMKLEEKRGFDPDNALTGVITANEYNAIDGETTVLNDEDELDYVTGEELFGHFVRAIVDNNGKVLALTDIGTVKTVDEDLDTAKKVKAALGKIELAKVNFVFGDKDYAVDDDAAFVGEYVFNTEKKLVAQILSSYVDWSLDKVTAVSTKEDAESVTLRGAGEVKKEALNSLDFKKNDIVLVKVVGEKTYLTKAEPVTGSISKVASNGKVTLDGKTYAASDVKLAKADVLADTKKASDLTPANLKDNKYSLYLDNDGAYIAITLAEEEVEIPDVYYWLKTTTKDPVKDDTVSYAIYATIIDASGAKSDKLIKTFKTTDERQKALDDGDYDDYKGELVTFKTVKGEVVITPFDAYNKDANLGPKSFTADEAKTFSAKANSVVIGKDKAYVNADTKFVFIDAKGNVDVKNGATTVTEKAAAAGKALYSEDRDENKVLKTVYIPAAYDEAKETDINAIYYVAAGAKPTTEAGYYTYTVYNAKGEKVEIKTLAPLAAANIGKFNYFSVDKDGYTDLTYIVEGDVAGYGKVYDSRYQESIRVKGDKNTDLDASKAVVVDTRAKGTVASIDDLAEAEDVVIDILYSKAKVIAAIFVYAAPKAK